MKNPPKTKNETNGTSKIRSKPIHHMKSTQNNLSLLAHTIEPTHRQPIKLNHIKGNAFKSCSAKDPKVNKEMNGIPKNL